MLVLSPAGRKTAADCQLTAPLCRTVLASDATTQWAGVCSAEIKEPELGTWLWTRRRPRHHKMMYAHEDPQRLLQPSSSSCPPDELLHAMVDSIQFVEEVRYRFAHVDHINALEGRAWLTGLKI
eukprot:1842981-Amphidinium_carterae.1